MDPDATLPISDFPVGPSVSHYRIIEKLGAGGMGVVYKGHDTKLNRTVALKFLPPDLRHNEDLKRRLTEEARAASALDHPNIVVIHEIDETPEGDLFIAMAFHGGATLRERIEGGIAPADALQIARQVASGLARAHEHVIFHRDIKPANIIVAKDGVARIIDFGLAKSSDVTATMEGGTKGTPLYMSPEQASGKMVDYRTDIWSLGAVLYEMLTGTPPYRGESQLAVMRAVVDGEPPRLRDGPAAAIVTRAMQKDPALRYQSAAEMERDLAAALTQVETPATPHRRSRKTFALAAAVTLLAALAGWLYRSSERRHWAREQAIPEITRLRGQDRPLAAYLLMRQAEQYLPGDPQLSKAADSLARTISLRSSPPGALVEIKDYLSPGDPWFALGTTPLENVAIPVGYLRWRVSKPGAGELLWAPAMETIQGQVAQLDFPLDLVAQTPQGTVPVPAAKGCGSYNWWFGYMGPWDLPQFYLDRYEVTNREYQEFVDKGGYQNREYWKEKFLRDGKELSWEDAMSLLRDASGRPGPAAWEAGHFPGGQADYPVTGVSWYEAMAYAEFAGKSLPSLAQWYRYAPPDVSRYISVMGNFSAPAPVGKYHAIGPFGTYDTAGNAAEWLQNGPGGVARYLAGGAWDTPNSDFGAPPFAILPFDRAARNGFRCLKNTSPLPPSATAPIATLSMDVSKAKPVTEETFAVYRSMYAYDRKPLHESRQAAPSESADWRKEAITVDAAYNGERLPLYLFLPARVRPPYQTVVFFPGASVLFSRSSQTLNDLRYIDYIIKSGRAVLYPIYKGTYERTVPPEDSAPSTAAGKDVLVQQCKDVSRALDYVESRADLDRGKIGYLGFSMGAANGVNMAALDSRLRSIVLLEAGIAAEKLFPGTNVIDFAPRVKQPVLMINGTYDMAWAGYKELYDLLGTPLANKKLLEFKTGHAVGDRREEMVQAVTAWLDQYLGPVN